LIGQGGRGVGVEVLEELRPGGLDGFVRLRVGEDMHEGVRELGRVYPGRHEDGEDRLQRTGAIELLLYLPPVVVGDALLRVYRLPRLRLEARGGHLDL